MYYYATPFNNNNRGGSQMAFSNVNGYDILKQAEIEEDNKESKLKSKITTFFNGNQRKKKIQLAMSDSAKKEKVSQYIQSWLNDGAGKNLPNYIQFWMNNAKFGLSLGHKVYFQSLCAIYEMLDSTAYKKYIKENKILVDLSKKQQLDSSVDLKSISSKQNKLNKFGNKNKLCKLLCNVYKVFFSYEKHPQAMQLLTIWQNIKSQSNELSFKTNNLKNLEIKGNEETSIELKDFKFN